MRNMEDDLDVGHQTSSRLPESCEAVLSKPREVMTMRVLFSAKAPRRQLLEKAKAAE